MNMRGNDASKGGMDLSELLIVRAGEHETDPYRNLAREEVLLRGVLPGQVVLYLWQNEHTVVIGRNQNALKECHVHLLTEEGGRLSRRLSGGGAVYHDLGNVNYTILCARELFDKERQTALLLSAVRSLGIEAEASGRNDLTAGGRKFSGNAYYLSKGACYQHGTLLLRIDETRMGRYLQVSRKKLSSKGVDSVRARVCALTEFAPELTVSEVWEALIQAAENSYGLKAKEKSLSAAEEAEVRRLTEVYASEEWLYGQKIPFSYELEERFSWGGVELKLRADAGRIEEAALYTDALGIYWPKALEKELKGRYLSSEGVRECFLELYKQEDLQDAGEELHDMEAFLLENL